MADKKTYRVLRPLDGDRFYRPGETREMFPADATHLVRLGVLEEVTAEDAPAVEAEPEPKAEPAPENKAEKPAKAKG